MEIVSLAELCGLGSLVFWLAVSLDRARSWPRGQGLPAAAGAPPAAAGVGLIALVPARDEADLLPLTLPTLLAQDVDVLLIDDGSTDGTAEAAHRAAAAAGRRERLRITTAPPTPPGWSGKVHALAHGLAEVERAPDPPPWLLLTDADISHRPSSIAALMEQARGVGKAASFDLVSVMARLHTETFWERLLVPPFVFFFQLLYPFRRVGRPGSRVAAAAGGCVLLRREALRSAGGFEALRGAVIDDVALARAVAAAGGRLWLGLDGGIRSLRRYRSLAEIWGMVSRTAFAQLRYSTLLLAPTLVGLGVLVASPPLIALASSLDLLVAESTRATAGRAIAWALLAWTLETRALWPAVRHHRLAPVWSTTLPFAAILYGLMTWSSAWRHWRGHGVGWKGRSYGRSDAVHRLDR